MKHTLKTLTVELEALGRRAAEDVVLRQRLLDERYASQQAALHEANQSLTAYKVANNEWRGTLADQRAAFLPRAEYDAKHEALAEALQAGLVILHAKLDDAIRRMVLIEGRTTGVGSSVSMMISILAIIAALAVGAFSLFRH